MMAVREIMNSDVTCVDVGQLAADVARLMRERQTETLPLCADGDKVQGIITARDLVVGVLASHRRPDMCLAGDLGQTSTSPVGAEDPVDEALTMMIQHRVQRLPVVEDARLVGMVALADIAKDLPDHRVGELVEVLELT